MSYRLIEQLQKKAIPVAHSCRVLEVSRSAYYAAQYRLNHPRICKEEVHLKAAFYASRQSYGSRRLKCALEAQGIRIGRYKVRSLMRRARLKQVWRRKFIHTTNSRHSLAVADNVLARQFNPVAPNLAFVSDITYIRTETGWLYLAVVLDLFSRKVVGWAMAPSMPSDLVCSALQMAITKRRPAPGLIVHSDRGSQYASQHYQTLLRGHGFVCSMSRKGNCWDNAVVERFFLNLKMERVWQGSYANHTEAKGDIVDYINEFYNKTRLHSTLGYLSPTAFERINALKLPIAVS